MTQTEPLHEVVCPSCDATIRARMADAPERSLMTTTDGDPITAAISYATLALLQLTRPDALAVLDAPPDHWPAEWPWEPAPTPALNLVKARNLIDLQLGEPGIPDGHYPSQEAVAEWVELNFRRDPLAVKTLGLVEEVGELCRAIIKREQGIRGTYDEWTAEIRKELGDIVIKLLDVAECASFDLITVAAIRWESVSQRDWIAAPKGHGLPDGDAA